MNKPTITLFLNKPVMGDLKKSWNLCLTSDNYKLGTVLPVLNYFSSVFIVIMFLSHSLALYVSILINSHCAQNIDIVSILLRLRRWEAIKRSYGLKYNCWTSNSKRQNHWCNRHCLLGIAMTSLKLKWCGRGNSKDILGMEAIGRRLRVF